MLAMHWGRIKDDDAYNRIRCAFGDSTNAEAQLRTLRMLRLDANFRTDGRPKDIEHEIDAGRPVAVGWLHQGSSLNPFGGGHWTVIIGYNDTHWIHNDPNGEAMLASGGYTTRRNGAGVAYSRRNWNPRWMVRGTGGWMLTCSKPPLTEEGLAPRPHPLAGAAAQ
jgi:hypothetical protein